jgi:hypothetical protein
VCQTPSGQSVPSWRYQDGLFYLLLPNPVPSGTFTCHVPAHQACLHGNHSATATLKVDTLKGRVAVMEARLAAQSVTQLQGGRIR